MRGTLIEVRIMLAVLCLILASIIYVGVLQITAVSPETIVSRTALNPVVMPGGELRVALKAEVHDPDCSYQNELAFVDGFDIQVPKRPWRTISARGEKGEINVIGSVQVPSILSWDKEYHLTYKTFYNCGIAQQVFGPIEGSVQTVTFRTARRGVSH